jgi:hypothetical protein
MKLPMLSAADKHAEIRRLYFRTTKQTIHDDLAKALDLLKSMASEEERSGHGPWKGSRRCARWRDRRKWSRS